MEESEKPKKVKKPFQFLRLKKTLNPPKPKTPKKKLTYKDLIPIEGVKPKPGMSQYQLKNFNKFMQVREGETHEQWQKRTRRYRIVEEEEAKGLGPQNKHKMYFRKKEKKRRLKNNIWHRDQSKLRDHTWLKYYGIVLNFFAIKHNIRKDFIELFMYFYENDPFTRAKLENAAVLICGSSKDVFKTLTHLGHVYPIIKYEVNSKNEEVPVELGLYKLNNPTIKMITLIYKILAKERAVSLHPQPALSILSKDEKAIFMEMNQEINEIITGKKPTEEI